MRSVVVSIRRWSRAMPLSVLPDAPRSPRTFRASPADASSAEAARGWQKASWRVRCNAFGFDVRIGVQALADGRSWNRFSLNGGVTSGSRSALAAQSGPPSCAARAIESSSTATFTKTDHVRVNVHALARCMLAYLELLPCAAFVESSVHQPLLHALDGCHYRIELLFE